MSKCRITLKKTELQKESQDQVPEELHPALLLACSSRKTAGLRDVALYLLLSLLLPSCGEEHEVLWWLSRALLTYSSAHAGWMDGLQRDLPTIRLHTSRGMYFCTWSSEARTAGLIAIAVLPLCFRVWRAASSGLPFEICHH